MKKPNETDALNELILRQEQQYDTDLRLLREQFQIAYESLKPINLIKDIVHEVTTTPEIKNNLLSNAIGLATGFISKKLLIDTSHNPIKKVLGTVLQFVIGNVVSKHSDGIKTIGGNLFSRFLNRSRN
ncbi:MAG TPA: hypothetical protein VIV55_01375 [Flavobacterium sp.]